MRSRGGSNNHTSNRTDSNCNRLSIGSHNRTNSSNSLGTSSRSG